MHRQAFIQVFLFVALLSGCGPKSVQAVQAGSESRIDRPSEMPTASEVLRITAPDYHLAPDSKSECLGRMAFEVKGQVEWPTFYDQMSPDTLFNRTFRENIFDAGDELNYNGMLIAVIGSVGGVMKEKVFKNTPEEHIALLENEIQQNRAYIQKLNKDRISNRKIKDEIEKQRENVERLQGLVNDYKKNFEKFETGVPDSIGYWTSEDSSVRDGARYSKLRAYLTRGDYIFVFESAMEMESAVAKELHKKKFSSVLARFRTRALNEIPTERGVCIPYGFIADNGTETIGFKQSLRFADAPGVLYTIDTGTVDPRHMKATPLLAAAEAMIKPPQPKTEGEVVPKVTKRIGPHLTKIGGLPASQGGVVLKLDLPKGKGYEIYSVFTGYGGWLSVNVLPYITVEMRTVNKNVATDLKENPPPFAISKNRLDAMLESMRWRPTVPPMPELVRK